MASAAGGLAPAAGRITYNSVNSLLVGGKHGFKTVSGGQNHFSHLRAARVRDFRRQHVFEFVRQFTQLVETARRGIALQRMHGAAHPAKDLFVGRIRFQFQPRLVQRLQQFVRALKKEPAKLRAAIFRRTTHELASSF